MNDIKTSERASLGQHNLAALMFWHYHGRNLKAWEAPVEEILKEFRAMADGERGRKAHRPAEVPKYEYDVCSSRSAGRLSRRWRVFYRTLQARERNPGGGIGLILHVCVVARNM